ncbi:MAG: flagellar filament capping protein FliD [Oscillospiraceae bacterium]|nr:flagellar filament capping protein FliD [Oscillospiraceae bacterium]
MSDSSTISATKSASGKLRLSGFSTGIDIDGLIEAALMNENAKIDKQKQNIQKQEWMQAAYETINKRIAEFQDAYLSIGGTDDVSLASALASRIVTLSDSSNISVTASGNATVDSLVIERFKKATAASISSQKLFDNETSSSVKSMKIKDLVEKLNQKDGVNIEATTEGEGDDATVTYSFKIKGETFTLGEDETVSDMLSKINNSGLGVTASFNTFTGKFTIASNETGENSMLYLDGGENDLLTGIFGEGAKDQLGNDYTMGGEETAVKGTQAEIKFAGNDDVFKFNGNTFTIDGYTFNILNDSGDSEPVTVNSKVDTDAMVGKIKKFVDAYNGLMATLYSYAYTTPENGYDPITDKDREKMTEKQIEEYEAKAKQGILYGNSDIKKLMSNMRSLFSSTVTESGLKLSHVGVTMAAYSKETAYGKIEVDEKKLRSAIEKNASDVAALFSSRSTDNGSTQGIAIEFKTLTQNYQNNYRFKVSERMNQKLAQMKELLETLKEKLADREDRLYKKYASMETSITKLSGQSSFLFG